MIDDYTKKLINIFEKLGDPADNKEKYEKSEFNNSQIKKLQSLYSGYKSGILREVVAISGIFPRVRQAYNGNIDELILSIKKIDDLESKMVIYIPNEINDLNHLERLKESFPDKEIIVNWDREIANIESVISAIHMISYYKSVISEDLSPLEKTTFAYDLVKSHYYKEYEVRHTMNSRNITKMVHNDSIVCQGYVKIFNRILKEFGISTSNLSVIIKSNNQEVNHARSIVKLSDDKYGINGYFVFDPTWDSADKEHYYQFDENNARYHKGQVDGFKRADALSSYKYFLVPLPLYESKFSNSYDEVITGKDNKKLDSNVTNRLLHSNQIKSDANYLQPRSFVELLYRVKQEEGYNIENIPKLIQESLYLSKYGYYKLKAINEVLETSLQSEIVAGKNRGFLSINFIYLIGLLISILTIIYCLYVK